MSETAEARLSSLVTLDVPDMRFSAREDARTASTDLDDSAWKAIHPNEEWLESFVWLRMRIVVPTQIHGYDIRGGRLSLSLSLRGTRAVRFFLNGVALNAGQEREPVLLTEHAVPGETLLVAVYVASDGEGERKHIREAKIHFEASNRPDPAVLGQEFLVAEAMLKGLAPSDSEHSQQLSTAINAIDLGRSLNTGRKRVPRPPQSTKALIGRL